MFAVNLRRYRHAAKLSQEELAQRADIDRTYISALERMVYAAGIDVVDRLAKVLGGRGGRTPSPPGDSTKCQSTPTLNNS